jgi:hypothetical protein
MSIIDAIDAAEAMGENDAYGVMIVPKWDEGHAEFKWKKGDPKDVEDARKYFLEKKAEGYLAYRVDPKSGDKGEVMKEFDPNAGHVFLIPPMKGG